MEPIHPELRAALKEAHPGLTDQDIDRAEHLLAQRMLIDPQADQVRLARLDREREDHVRRTMPRYAEVAAVVNARLARTLLREGDPDRPKVRVEVKRPRK